MSVNKPSKKIFLVVGFVLVLALAAIASQKYLAGNLGGNKQDGKKTAVNYKKYKACDLLKLDEAKKIAGAGIKAFGEPRVSETSNNDSNDSSCAYTFEVTSGRTSTIKTIDVRALSALNPNGEQNNKAAFSAKETLGAKKIDVYGEANWNAASGELSVLKVNTLLTITIKTASLVNKQTNTENKPSPDNTFVFVAGSLDDAKKVTDIVITRL